MTWLIVAVTAAAAGLLQTVTGFGSVVLMMMVFPFLFDMVDAPALALVSNYLLCLVLSWRYRRHIRLRLALLPTAIYSVVCLVVIRTIGALDSRTLVIAFGAFYMLLSAYFLTVARHAKLRPGAAVGAACGAFCGITAGFFAVGGPPMALYFVAATDSQEQYVACMQFLFAVTNTISIIGRISEGLLRPVILPYAAVGTVCILLGMLLGQRIVDKLNAQRMRTIVYVFVGISGLILVLQSL